MGISAHERYEAAVRRNMGLCDLCGDDFNEDTTPNIEAFDLSGEIVCDECAEQIFEDSSQFGVGA